MRRTPFLLLGIGWLLAVQLAEARQTAGGVVLDASHRKILLVRVVKLQRGGHSGWTLPKGRVEDGSLLQNARREVAEEAGVSTRVLARMKPTRRRSVDCHLFLMEATGSVRPLENGEIAERRWVFLDEAKRLLDAKADRKALKAAKQRLKAGL